MLPDPTCVYVHYTRQPDKYPLVNIVELPEITPDRLDHRAFCIDIDGISLFVTEAQYRVIMHQINDAYEQAFHTTASAVSVEME